jgi:RimJ/RimL family protein N-acetyltransferase
MSADRLIRPATTSDAAATWRIIGPTIRAVETYAFPRDLTEAESLDYWIGSDRKTFVPESEGEVLGTYYIRPDQSGGGAHVCDCGYMTAADAVGKGLARAMRVNSPKAD